MKKWQNKFDSFKLYRQRKNQNLLFRNVPISVRENSYGTCENYTIGDVIECKYLNGYNVLHPMGWDSFGLPAENASKLNKMHPKEWTNKNISTMKKQLKLLGLSIDWDLEISTCNKNYYKHQQELFIDFYNKGLVSRKETYVNWDRLKNLF